MKFYVTQGTTDYLDRLRISCGIENMYLFTNDFNGLLVHETTGLPVFKEPLKYEVIHSVGNLDKVGYLVLNHIPVTEEGRPNFEYTYKKSDYLLQQTAGFVAFRVLRPVQNNTYVLLTLWENEAAYKHWKNSKSNTHDIDNEKKTVYPQPSYVKTYTTYQDDEERE